VTQILWLASYPKSGNTWLRAFLANYLSDSRQPVDINTLPEFSYSDIRTSYYEQVSGKAIADLEPAEVNRLRPRVHRLLAAARPGVVFVKTHSMLTRIDGVPTITPEVTRGAVYVVRNPLDAGVSFGHHYGLPMENVSRALCFSGLKTVPQPDTVTQFLSDWSNHLKSWLNTTGLPRKVIRYEDMVASPDKTFGEVIDFLDMPKDRDRIKRAIRHSSFKTLAKQERSSGFVEQSNKSEAFFRRGVVGGWRNELSDEQAEHMIRHHREMMMEMGYLSAKDELLV